MALDGDHHKRLGKARLLYEVLIDWQTDPEGRVNYGRPVTYVQIAKRIENPPRLETLRKWMRRSRKYPYLETRTVYRGCSVVGIAVKVLKPKKWATQLPLFGAENVVQMKKNSSVGSSTAERQTSSLKVAGSNPAPAPKVCGPARDAGR